MHSHSAFLITLLLSTEHRMGAEIGVFEGDNTAALLSGLDGLEYLLCVDPWKHYPEFDASTPNKAGKVANADFEKVEEKFWRQVAPFKSRVELMKEESVSAALHVTNESLDFVFIDGNHAYDYVKEDIDVWLPKVKKGGLLIGHDYVTKPGYGVIGAVQKSFTRYYVNKPSKCWYVTKE
jgi:hypothetical protein